MRGSGRRWAARPVLSQNRGLVRLSSESGCLSLEGRGLALRVVVIGGTGLIGSRVVAILREGGHEAVPASPSTGVDTVTGKGLAEVMAGADVVVDVSNAPVWRTMRCGSSSPSRPATCWRPSAYAGVGHHVALTIVGADLLPDSGYLRAKVAQEAEIDSGGVPHTIVRATQFFEFLPQIAEAGAEGGSVRLSTGLMQFVAAADVGRHRRRAGDRRAGQRPGRTWRPRGPGHRRLGTAPVRGHRRRADGRLRPARPLLRYRAQGRRAHGGRRRPYRGNRLRHVVRRVRAGTSELEGSRLARLAGPGTVDRVGPTVVDRGRRVAIAGQLAADVVALDDRSVGGDVLRGGDRAGGAIPAELQRRPCCGPG